MDWFVINGRKWLKGEVKDQSNDRKLHHSHAAGIFILWGDCAGIDRKVPV